MKELEEIKISLKEMQSNFNPRKQTYKIIDEIVNNSLNPEEVLEKLKLIKGTDKYPEDIKNKYIKLVSKVQELVFEDRKKEEERVRNEQTKELKSLIEKLENTQKNNKIIDQDKNIELEKEETLDEEENADENNFSLENGNNNDLVHIENVVDNDKSKKIFLILLGLVIISIAILVFIFIFF